MRRHLVVKIARGAAVATLFLVALMGFAHTKTGRPLLAAVGRLGRAAGAGSCPLGYDRLTTPQAREQARLRFAASHRGQIPAQGRPALGFVLDQTSRSEVMGGMKAHGIDCRSGTTQADLICENVPAAILPTGYQQAGPRELWFTFGPQDRLTAVVALSRAPAAARVSAAFVEVTAAVSKQAGPATRVTGDSHAASLQAGSLRQASSEFAFADYYACARATNLGREFLLTEEYRSLTN